MAEENYKLHVHTEEFLFECSDGSIFKMAPSHDSWDIKSIAQYTWKQFRTDFRYKVFDLDDLQDHQDIRVSVQLPAHEGDELFFQVGDERMIHLNVKVVGQSKKRKMQKEDYREGEEVEVENLTRYKRQKENEDQGNKMELVHQMERSPEENAAEVCLQVISPVGLVNRENCCFANAALQCLFTTREFVSYHCGKSYSQECRGLCFTCAMFRIIQKAQKLKPFFASDVLDNISALGGDFVTGLGDHRDSLEFIMKLLERMSFETKHGDIKSIFCLTYETLTTCTKCKRPSIQPTKTTQLDLDITCPQTNRDLNTLEECLGLFISEKMLDGNNNCKYEIATMHDYVASAPNILILGIKKYKDGKKVDRLVAYPSELNLAPYMKPGNDEAMYDLYGAVVHTGSLAVGHYISYIRTHDGWSMVDDEKVKFVNANEVLDKNAYVLFYRRRGSEHMGNAAADMASHTAAPPALDATSSKKQDPPSSLSSSPSPSPPPENAQRLFSTRTLPRHELEERFIMVQDRKPLDVIERIEKAMEFSNPSKKEYCFHMPGKHKVIYNYELMQYCIPRRDGFRKWSTEDPEKRDKALRIAFLLDACLQILKLKITNSDSQDPEDDMSRQREIIDPEDDMSRQREIYYRNKVLFGGETYEDGYEKLFVPAVSEVCMLLGCTRASLGLSVDPRGWIIGPVILYKGKKVHIDCRLKQQIISDDSQMVDFIKKKGRIDFLLIVEKECTFDILRAIKFHKKHNCIVVTGKGYPTIATRAVVRKLVDTFNCPVYGLADLDRDGLQIICTYKFGSKKCAYDNLYLSVPELVWLGVHPVDFFKKGDKAPDRNLSDRDSKIIESFMESLPPQSLEATEIGAMVEAGIRRDIHSKYHRGNIEVYIMEKIRARQAAPVAPAAPAAPAAPVAGRGRGRGGRDRGRGRGGRDRGQGRGGRGIRDRGRSRGSKGRGRGVKIRAKVRGRGRRLRWESDSN